MVYFRSLCNRELIGVVAWRKTVLYRGEREREMLCPHMICSFPPPWHGCPGNGGMGRRVGWISANSEIPIFHVRKHEQLCSRDSNMSANSPSSSSSHNKHFQLWLKSALCCFYTASSFPSPWPCELLKVLSLYGHMTWVETGSCKLKLGHEITSFNNE